MILYKYVNYTSGLKIIENNNIGFRQPIYFNDPCELDAAYPSEENSPPKTLHDNNPELKKLAWGTFYAVLSLTRSPNNSLMWAHYGDQHQGFVIGFEANHDIFTSIEKNIIPVQFGNVIYVSTKPIHEFLHITKDVIEIGAETSFKPDFYERYQRLYLYKPLCWAYEEEVRIVKSIFGVEEKSDIVSGTFEIIENNGENLYLLKLPSNTIKEIYLGIRNPLVEIGKNEIQSKIKEKIKCHSDNVKISICSKSNYHWEIDTINLD